jgi:hypothetical protein
MSKCFCIFILSFVVKLYYKKVLNLHFSVATNVQVFMKKGEFGTRQPVTDAGFCSKVELLPKLHSIPSAGANVD